MLLAVKTTVYDDADDNGIDNSVDNGIDNSDDCANKHVKHLSQAVDCCLAKRSKQNKHVVGNKDNSCDDADDIIVDNGVDNGVDKH
eukprot:7433581-Ditylum_brightwellii.AAC.1